MRLFRRLAEVWHAEPMRSLWVTLGTFDGLHRGHQAVLARLKERCAVNSDGVASQSLVITFEENPKAILADAKPQPILALGHKVKLLAESGVDATLLLKFDHALSKISAEEFVREWLVNQLHVKGVVLGYDGRFGHQARGDFALLSKLGAEFGFAAEQVEPVLVRGQPISSTAIRKALMAADLTLAAEFLGRPFSILGRVVKGAQRGRTLGFPTANFYTAHDILLPLGVYGVRVRRLAPPRLGEDEQDEESARNIMIRTTDHHRNSTQDQRWGIANLGFRPTISSPTPRPVLEVHLLEFDGDLYGRKLEVEFFVRLRAEQKFPSLDALKAQITADRAQFVEWIRMNEH